MEKSLELFPNNNNSINNLARVYLDENELDSAFELFHGLILHRPDYELAIENMKLLGWKAFDEQNYKLAEKAAKSLLKTDDKEVAHLELMAAIKINQGQLANAIGYMEEILKSSPKNESIIQNLFLANKELGDTIQAKKYQQLLQALN